MPPVKRFRTARAASQANKPDDAEIMTGVDSRIHLGFSELCRLPGPGKLSLHCFQMETSRDSAHSEPGAPQRAQATWPGHDRIRHCGRPGRHCGHRSLPAVRPGRSLANRAMARELAGEDGSEQSRAAQAAAESAAAQTASKTLKSFTGNAGAQ